MKATGIVRRIDDLGRVVIPKEIRRTLRIREGDPLEIFVDRDGEIILKKYSPIGELGEFAKEYAESLAETLGHTVCITDRDSVIAVSGGSKKDFLGQEINGSAEKVMESRRSVIVNKDEIHGFSLFRNMETNLESLVVAPIISSGDPIGTVLILSKEESEMGVIEQKMAESAAGFLGKQMEQ